MNEGCDGCVSKERMSNGSSATQWQILERFSGITRNDVKLLVLERPVQMTGPEWSTYTEKH